MCGRCGGQGRDGLEVEERKERSCGTHRTCVSRGVVCFRVARASVARETGGKFDRCTESKRFPLQQGRTWGKAWMMGSERTPGAHHLWYLNHVVVSFSLDQVFVALFG